MEILRIIVKAPFPGGTREYRFLTLQIVFPHRSDDRFADPLILQIDDRGGTGIEAPLQVSYRVDDELIRTVILDHRNHVVVRHRLILNPPDFLLMGRTILCSQRLASRGVSKFDRSVFSGLIGSFVAILVADASGTRFFSPPIFAVFCTLAGLVSGSLASYRADFNMPRGVTKL